MRLLIADDHALVRAGLRLLISALGNYQVIGEASNNHETIANLEQIQPDMLLLDISMPDGSGLDIIKPVREFSPQIKILILSMHSSLLYVNKALLRGANGFLVKDAAPSELKMAFETIKRGQVFLSSSISNELVDAWGEHDSAAKRARLSPRQQEILDLISKGYNTREIAEQLQLSIKTIETHRSRMVSAVGLKNGTELLRYALSSNS